VVRTSERANERTNEQTRWRCDELVEIMMRESVCKKFWNGKAVRSAIVKARNDVEEKGRDDFGPEICSRSYFGS
jgi:hypothetical protein